MAARELSGSTTRFTTLCHHDGFAFKWSEPTGLVVWRNDSPEATSLRPDGAGDFYVVEQATRQLARWNAQGQGVAVLADRFEGKRFNRPNDCAAHSNGRVWFTDPDFLFKQPPQDHLWVCAKDGIRILRLDGQVRGLLQTTGMPTSTAFGPENCLAVPTRDDCYVTRLR